MGVQNPNSTNYVHPNEPNLLDLHSTMQYNSSGQPVIRTHVDGITLEGDVVIDKVKVIVDTSENTIDENHPVPISATSALNSDENPIYVNVTNGISTVNQGNSGSQAWKVDIGSNGTVTVNQPVAVTQHENSTPWQISKDSDPNTDTNPIYVTGNMTATISGTVSTMPDGASSVSAFGEPFGLTITPVIQIDSIYGITDEVVQTYKNGTGSVADANPSNALFSVQSGTTAYGYGVLRSRRFLRYRPGQGALARFTASFTPNVSLNTQRAGLFNQENAIMIGWNDDGVHGPRFGILRSTGARTHITVLTLNTAPTGNQTATVTLNGVAFNISITAGTTQATAVLINRIDGFTGWLTDQVDNTIVFMSTAVGPKNGTYSFSSSGAGTLATGTFSTKQAGVDATNNWTYQSEFNVDRLDGTKGGPSDIGKNPSGMTLASEHLNVYQINFRWLGVGEIRFAIEDELTGALVFFHRVHYTNQYNLPHVTQPSFKVGYVSSNMGGTTNATVTGVCMMAAIEGEIKQNELNRSAESTKAGLAQNVLHHVMTIRNPYVTNGSAGALNGNYILNAKEIILKDISLALQGQDPGVVYLFYNATSFSGTHSYYSQPKDNGMISTETGTLDPAVDTAICRFVVAINGEAQYKLSDFRIAIPPGDSISIGIRSTNGITRLSTALVFSED